MRIKKVKKVKFLKTKKQMMLMKIKQFKMTFYNKTIKAKCLRTKVHLIRNR